MKGISCLMVFGLIIAILNMFDGLATNYGLTNHYIEEVNPVMRLIAEISPALFIGVKLSLSLLILIVSYLVYKSGNCSSKSLFQKFFLYSLVGVTALYAGVFCLHIYWLSISGSF
ncbi:DUF5658 family protein [Ureibacillus terrenus]|uniref:DUF5658 domain-containing protein n=2 Tax=Caryophanaceae TaxID=186818 RepID=A0A540V499_9BACL|nr:DUF5658 family protein [Ureibacillus terrenus]MED3763567.1 DUF5658 family protein [Ureibacillus terrenus]TQE91053.1 hypothetical protein FKZ59_06995 [Ureibacillus terrenus]